MVEVTDCIGKKVSYQFKVPPGREKNYEKPKIKTGTIESLVIKLDKPGMTTNRFGTNTTHVKAGGPKDQYEIVSMSGGKRRTMKMRKSGRKNRKSNKQTRKSS